MRSNFDEMISRLVQHQRNLNVSKNKLADEAGIHVNTLKGLGDPNWNPRLDTLRKIDEAIARLLTDFGRKQPVQPVGKSDGWK